MNVPKRIARHVKAHVRPYVFVVLELIDDIETGENNSILHGVYTTRACAQGKALSLKDAEGYICVLKKPLLGPRELDFMDYVPIREI